MFQERFCTDLYFINCGVRKKKIILSMHKVEYFRNTDSTSKQKITDMPWQAFKSVLN